MDGDDRFERHGILVDFGEGDVCVAGGFPGDVGHATGVNFGEGAH